MTLENGKFFDNGKEVPLEHGNLEQIRLMNQHLQAIELEEEAEAIGIAVEQLLQEEVEWKYSCEFRCPCGELVEVEDQSSEDMMVADYFEDYRETCHGCKKTYVLKIVNENLTAIPS